MSEAHPPGLQARRATRADLTRLLARLTDDAIGRCRQGVRSFDPVDAQTLESTHRGFTRVREVA